MSISKENFLSSLAYFRQKMLEEISNGYVVKVDGSSLMTSTEHEQLKSLVDATGIDTEDVTNEDIDTIFTTAASGTDGEDTPGSGEETPTD